jgi:hypothetical protein
MKFFTLHEQEHNEKKFQEDLQKFDSLTTVWRGPSGDLAIGDEELDEDIFGDYSPVGIVREWIR